MRSLQQELARVTGRVEPEAASLRPVATRRKYPNLFPAQGKAVTETQHQARMSKAQCHTGKVASHRQWAKHDVDMNPFFHGKRKAKRGGASETNVGMALELAKHTTRENFVNGKGLVRRKCKYSLYVEGLRRGYLQDINQALAWAKAASSFGLHGQCVEE